MENGERCLSCKNKEYILQRGNIVLFNPGDNHACVQSDDGTFAYRGLNISQEVILNLTEEATGKRELPGFSENVIVDEEVTCYLRPLHEMIMKDFDDLGREENLLLLISLLIQRYGQSFERCIPECRDEIEKVCRYYLLENIALTYTMASNVGVIISVAPFFTAILSHLFLKEEGRLRVKFFGGFAVAMAGIFLISFNGAKLELNPAGDLLALLAAFVWACYSILTKRISSYGYSTILTTRRVFLYGILFMIPAMFLLDFHLELGRFVNPTYLINIIFLGLGASALCFVSWNFAVKILGTVKTSVYIYMVPVITVVTSVLILHEKITGLSILGTLLTLTGLFLSESRN